MAEVDQDGCAAMDFLSELPDELLSHILSFLELKDAVRAKLLAHRWKHLYPGNPTISSRFTCNGCYLDDCTEFEDHQDEFVARVDKFMQQFRAPNIKSFELAVPYDPRNWTDGASFVDEWIRLACLMRAERIDFQLGCFISNESYMFPLHLLHAAGSSNLRELEIFNCSLPHFSSLASPIISLRILQFSSVCFHENNVTSEDIASYFPNLETLHILCCEQLTSMRQLDDLCLRFIYLKSLRISVSSSVGPEFFEIHNTNLTNFTSVGGMKWLFFKGLKGLQYFRIRANFSGQYAANFLSNIPEEFPQLVRLSISSSSDFFPFPSFMSGFNCLKYLRLSVDQSPETDLQSLSKILHGAPLLQEFHINLFGKPEQWSGEWLEERILKKKEWLEERLSPQHVMQDAHEMLHVHLHLRKIHIETLSYFGQNEVELIIMLLNCATSLEKMKLICYLTENKKELQSVQSVLATYFPRVNFTTLQ